MKIFLISLAIVLCNLANAQNIEIVGLTFPACTLQAMYFDTVNHQLDSTVIIKDYPDDLPPNPFQPQSAIDPFNGRYFLMSYKWHSVGAPTSTPNYDTTIVRIVDLHTYKIDSVIVLNALSHVRYDPFSNQLIGLSDTTILGYDLSNNKLDTLNTISINSQLNYAELNYIDERYECYELKQFAFAGTEAKASGAVPKSTYNGASLVFDCKNDRMLGRSDNSTAVVSIDENNGDLTKLSNNAPDFFAILNNPVDLYDANHDLFISQYTEHLSVRSKLAFINLSSGKIDTVHTDNLFNCGINGQYAPIAKKKADIILVTYGKGYQWYRNDTLITGAVAQKYKPTSSGYYKALVTLLDNESKYSNEVYFDVSLTGVTNQLNATNNLKVYPNPSYGTVTLSFDNKQHLLYYLNVYNLVGANVYNSKGSLNTIIIPQGALSPGVYSFSLISFGNGRMNGKFVIQ